MRNPAAANDEEEPPDWREKGREGVPDPCKKQESRQKGGTRVKKRPAMKGDQATPAHDSKRKEIGMVAKRPAKKLRRGGAMFIVEKKLEKLEKLMDLEEQLNETKKQHKECKNLLGELLAAHKKLRREFMEYKAARGEI